MKKDEKNTGVSLFAQSEYLTGQDPIEEIFALNLGDFISENLISEELARKIGENVKDKKVGLINQLKELVSIYSLQNTLCVMSFDEGDIAIYNSVAHSLKQMCDVDECAIYLEKNNVLELAGATSKDFSSNYAINGKSAAAGAYLTKETVIEDIIAIPMFSSIKSVGVIVINNKKELNKKYMELAESMGILFATSTALQKTIDETNRLIADETSALSQLQHMRAELTALIADLCDYQQNFVEHLANAVDKKGGYKVSHSKNTANIAKQICKQLKLNEKTTDLIYYAALLQNIGKIALPEEIFATDGKLSADDLKKIRDYSNVGVHLLMKINFLSEVVPYITYQKERYDGSGVPEGLSGQSIPFGSRIISVADAYSAMISDRPYRKAMDTQKAFEIIVSEAGSKWDPVVIEALGQVIK